MLELLGLVAASLLAAFMSTIDTHINLAASYFVNDVYRRFVARAADERHYIGVARIASAAVLAISGTLAFFAESISELFLFLLAFLSGVGPVYVLRWLWWRVRASTEVTAMLVSCATSTALTFLDQGWRLGPLSPGGELSSEGRLILTVLVSTACALASMLVTRTSDPAELVPFYRRVRPFGAWGPVRARAGLAAPRGELLQALLGSLASLVAILGFTLGMGFWLLDRRGPLLVAVIVAGAGILATALVLRRMRAPLA